MSIEPNEGENNSRTIVALAWSVEGNTRLHDIWDCVSVSATLVMDRFCEAARQCRCGK